MKIPLLRSDTIAVYPSLESSNYPSHNFIPKGSLLLTQCFTIEVLLLHKTDRGFVKVKTRSSPALCAQKCIRYISDPMAILITADV